MSDDGNHSPGPPSKLQTANTNEQYRPRCSICQEVAIFINNGVSFCSQTCFENHETLLLRDMPTQRTSLDIKGGVVKPIQVVDSENEPHVSKHVGEQAVISDIVRQQSQKIEYLENELEVAKVKIADLERSNLKIQRGQADRITTLYDIVNDLVEKRERDRDAFEENAAIRTKIEEDMARQREIVEELQRGMEVKDGKIEVLIKEKQIQEEDQLNIKHENKKLERKVETLVNENERLKSEVKSLAALEDVLRRQQSEMKIMKKKDEEIWSRVEKNSGRIQAVSDATPTVKELRELEERMLKKAGDILKDVRGMVTPNVTQTFNISNNITQPSLGAPEQVNTTGGANGIKAGNDVTTPTPESTNPDSESMHSRPDSGFDLDSFNPPATADVDKEMDNEDKQD
ncbi:myosin-6-like isoform X2 [Ptychodera flava]|uniref:myosin-6-like isoform X2 n=1 Tax=Ptychodera flava TaxID=63121 RepID=UPI003969E41F